MLQDCVRPDVVFSLAEYISWCSNDFAEVAASFSHKRLVVIPQQRERKRSRLIPKVFHDRCRLFCCSVKISPLSSIGWQCRSTGELRSKRSRSECRVAKNMTMKDFEVSFVLVICLLLLDIDKFALVCFDCPCGRVYNS